MTPEEKRGIFNNDTNRIRKHKNYLKSILKKYGYDRNKIDRRLEDKMNSLLHKYDIKPDFFWREIEWSKLQKINGTSY